MDTKDGVYFDTKAGKVTTTPPEEGVQLVEPGGALTPEIQSRIDAYEGKSDDGDKTVKSGRAKAEAAAAE